MFQIGIYYGKQILVYITSQNPSTSIINELKSGKKHFNELKEKLGLTPRTVSFNLEKMYDQGMINRAPLQIGKPRYYWLTDVTKLEMELGYFGGLKSKRNRTVLQGVDNKEKEGENMTKIIVRLMLRRAALGTTRLGNPKPITKLTDKNRGYVVFSKGLYYEPAFVDGFSIEDIIENRDFVDGSMFKHKFDKEHIERMVNKLTKREPRIIKPYYENGEWIYRLNDDNLLKKFVSYCEVMFSHAIIRMEEAWKLRKRKPNTGEVDWYKSIYGKDKTTQFFLVLNEEKKRFRKESYREKQKREKLLKKGIECWDQAIRSLDYSLKGNEFDEIRNSGYIHYRTFSKLLLDEAYPNFLKVLHERKQK